MLIGLRSYLIAGIC